MPVTDEQMGYARALCGAPRPYAWTKGNADDEQIRSAGAALEQLPDFVAEVETLRAENAQLRSAHMALAELHAAVVRERDAERATAREAVQALAVVAPLLPAEPRWDRLEQIAELRARLGDPTRSEQARATAVADLERQIAQLRADRTARPSTFDELCATRLADEVAVLVRRRVIDARSPAADALLDYRDPPSTPRADRLAELERQIEEQRARADKAERDRGDAIAQRDHLCAEWERTANDWRRERDEAIERADELERDRDRLRALIHTPRTDEWFEAVRLEAAHQIERWGVEHDAGKRPEDWIALVAYLLGKSAAAHYAGDRDKLLHRIVTTGAALMNWHRAATGIDNRMRPGVGPSATPPAAPAEGNTP